MGNYRPPDDGLKEMDDVEEMEQQRQQRILGRQKLPVRDADIIGTRKRPKADDTERSKHMESLKEIERTEGKCSKIISTQMQSLSVKTEPKTSIGGVSINLLLIIIVLSIGLVASVYTFVLRETDRSDQFDNWFQQMENDFPKQYNFTWKILKRSLKKFLKDGTNSPQPTIILMLGTGDNRKIVNCLSDRVKTMIEDLYDERDCMAIKSKELVQSNDTFLKLEMESNVTRILDEMECHVLVIEDIDLLRAVGLNLLQAYCDHENAPHKTVTIILTATTKKKPPTSLPNDGYETLLEFNKLAREHLDDAWKTVSSDYRDAWLSRFMQYVVVTGEVTPPTTCANKKN